MAQTVLQLDRDRMGIFRSRPNRFLGLIKLDEPDSSTTNEVYAHIHDPGRLKELLYPGNLVLLKKAVVRSKRKTVWDVLAAKFNGNWILIHSGYHRAIAEWVLTNGQILPFGNPRSITPEVSVGDSRLDFELIDQTGRRVLIEVKGCTLAENGVALFPDAPTARGRRHLDTLLAAKQNASNGLECALVVLVFRPDAIRFMPNARTDPEFARLFYHAYFNGIEVYPLVFEYDSHRINYLHRISVSDSNCSLCNVH